jgi:sugar phosphate isomerase/epimerase
VRRAPGTLQNVTDGLPGVPAARVALSTASTYPETTAAAFEMASRLGYDGVEVMVWTDPLSQNVDELKRLSDEHEIPILAIHSPCLLLTQRVWGNDPWLKLEKARDAAAALHAETVVVHPPFRWQRDYALKFIEGINRMADETHIKFAVENMFPLRARGRSVVPYAPDWNPLLGDYKHFTLDLSHTSVSRSNALAMAHDMADGLVHVHLADGSGSAKDEHLVPGRGQQPCAELLEMLAQQHFAGTIVIEINTRKALDRADREADLAEALAFTRLNLAFGPETEAGLRPRKPLPHIPTGARFRASADGIDDLYGDARRATP